MRTAATHTPSRSAGFTLVELIVVVVVLAILSAAAIPSVGAMRSIRERGATQQLLRDVSFARQRAQATGVTSWVRFSPASSAYSVLAESSPGAGRGTAITITDPATNAPMSVSFSSGDLAGVTLQVAGLTGNEVGFDRYGRPMLVDTTILTSNATITLSAGPSVTITARSGLVWATFP